jgi:polygalacturonase
VFISDCDIQVADDAICLKSENPYGPLRDTRNITITNCLLSGCCNAFKIGTATEGGFADITFTNSVITSRYPDPPRQLISGLAIEMVDGGWLDGLTVANIRMRDVRTPLFVRLGNRGNNQPEPVPGRLANVLISGVHATGASVTSSITGLAGHPVDRLTLRDININTTEPGEAAWADRDIPERPEAYPEAFMFGRLPAHGLYLRHARAVRLAGLVVESANGDPRPLLVADDVDGLDIDGVAGQVADRAAPLLRCHDVRGAFVHGCQARPGTDVFLRASGPRQGRIGLAGNDFSNAVTAVDDRDPTPR